MEIDLIFVIYYSSNSSINFQAKPLKLNCFQFLKFAFCHNHFVEISIVSQNQHWDYR